MTLVMYRTHFTNFDVLKKLRHSLNSECLSCTYIVGKFTLSIYQKTEVLSDQFA